MLAVSKQVWRYYMNIILNKCKKLTWKQITYYVILLLCVGASFIFIQFNHGLYDQPIAKVIETTLEETTEVTDIHNNEDILYTQKLKAVIKNGSQKGQIVYLTNKYSSSGAYDQSYHIGNELFVWLDKNETGQTILTGSISDVKRDKYLLPVLWIFIFTLLFIGKKQGLFAIVSLIINAVLLAFALDIYVNNANISLLLVCGVTVILFTVTSLLLVNGLNEKTYAAIFATLLGTFASVFIAYFVLWVTGENGIRYEAMDFLTRPYKIVFLSGLFIGSLGAVMDVAITMSSSVFELFEKDNEIPVNVLKKSGLDIGKDIMGTMTSILFFAYISGSIPMLILYFKNGSPLHFTLSLHLSLELARALAGGIGIVLTIPIGLYISIFFVNRKRAKS